MKAKRKERTLLSLVVVSALFLLCIGQPVRAEFTPGMTYDKTNVQEIAHLLPKSLQRWITEDQYVMKTGEIEGWGHSPKFMALTQENKDKFDLDENGNLVLKNGEKPTFFMGMPFPVVDPADPRAGEKIIQNMFASRYYYQGAGGTYGTIYYIGQKGGPEREVGSGVVNLYYWNRRQGEISNPSGLISQRLNYVFTPMELNGTTQMAWSYSDEREDSAFAYIPAVRRVRRVSAAIRSDPWLGSDATVDSTMGFDGKPSSMKWKLLEEKTMLVAVTTLDTWTYPVNQDGSYTVDIKKPAVVGYQDKNWKGPSYSLLSVFWVPRKVYVIEAIPKDPYYNYSKFHMYIDKEVLLFQVIDDYDRSGEYWKTQLGVYQKTVLSDGEPVIPRPSLEYFLDWKTKHCTLVGVGDAGSGITMDSNLPVNKVGPKFFSEANLKQITK